MSTSVKYSRQRMDVDAFLSRLSTYACSQSNQDRCLKLLAYICWFLSKTAPKAYRNRKECSELCKGLRKMYSHIVMVRYASRLFGVPAAIEGIRTGSWGEWGSEWLSKESENCVPRSIRLKLGKFMAWCMLFYYPLENAAYLHWIAPEVVRVNAEKLSAVSCQMWGLYITGDIIQSFLKLRVAKLKHIQYEELIDAAANGKKSDDGTNRQKYIANVQGKLLEWKKKIFLQYLQLLRNAFYFLPLISWSMPNWQSDPLLDENVVNSLCLGESIVCFWQSIYSAFYS